MPTKTRKPKDRTELKARLLEWRTKAAAQDDFLFTDSPFFVLDDASIKTLAALLPDNLTTTALMIALKETEEWKEKWAEEILAVIQAYDQELESTRKTAIADRKKKQKLEKEELDLAGFQQESNRVRAETEQRLRESAAQGSSRFANTR